jgi:hypothetical protein
MSIVPLQSGELELGDEQAQLRQLVDAIEAHLHRIQEAIAQDTQDLKQVEGIIVEQRRVAEQEKVSLQAKFEEDKAQMQQEKEQLLAEKLKLKEAINKALHSVEGLEP